MSFIPVTLLTVLLDISAQPVPVGRLALKDRRIYFEYDRAFLERRLELSPFSLPLKAGVFSSQESAFEGLFGLFNDSLPDGWGRLLLDRQLRQRGIAPERLSALDRLAHVGRHGMGALCYEPDHSEGELPASALKLDMLARESAAVLVGKASEVLGELLALNGSSAGARPKVMVAVNADKKRIISGLANVPDDMEPWIIKFAASLDARDTGPIEYAYSLMAKEAGLNMPETHLFPAAEEHGYFGVRRFDRQAGQRLHMHTVSGLLHADHRLPSLDYETILKATLHLTRSMPEVEAMFRLAVFNVLTHNRDDHAKNFAFLMDRNGTWRVAPVYDLTFSSGPGGEHCTTIMGEGRNPGISHLTALAEKMGLSHAGEIIEKVRDTVSRWKAFAKEAGVSKESMNVIDKTINA